MWIFKKSKKKMESVMIYTKITELKDRYMIYNAVKNERKWRNKEMDLDEEELIATRDGGKKSADKMFKELGYEKEEDLGDIYYKSKYGTIWFTSRPKEINFISDGIDTIGTITMQELQAINKKVEELGWK